jgi:putative FmdB family regulatory protein
VPIYEYKCNGCGQTFETLVFNAKQEQSVACRICASANVTKLLSVFAAGTDSSTRGSLPVAPSGCGRCGDPQGPCGAN